MKNKIIPIIEMLVLIVAGIVLICNPGGSLTTAVTIIGIALAVYGVVAIIRYLADKEKSGPDLVAGIIAVVAGIFVLCAPKVVVSIFPVIIGILVAVAGLKGIASAFAARKRSGGWLLSCVLSLITLIIGIVILLNPFGTVETVVVVLGVVLIYIGITGIIAALKG